MRHHDFEGVAQVDDLATEDDAARIGQHTRLLSPCPHEHYPDLRDSSRHSANSAALRP